MISLIIISMFKKHAFAVDVAFILNFCPFQSDKIATILKAAGVSVEPYWPCMYMLMKYLLHCYQLNVIRVLP